MISLINNDDIKTDVFQTWSRTFREEHRLRMFEKRVLRRIFGPKRERVAGGCRRLHDEELQNLYTSPDTIRVIKSRGMRWMGHVTHMGVMRNAYKILVGKPEGKRHSEDLGIDGKIVLEWILGK
jgi:hypothetical protein